MLLPRHRPGRPVEGVGRAEFRAAGLDPFELGCSQRFGLSGSAGVSPEE